MALRPDQRKPDELRPVRFTLDYQYHPAGSVLVEFGRTRVLCAVSVTAGVPRWRRDQQVGGGWLTAEYQMLPGATGERTEREIARLKPHGRSVEIQRLIGRSLRPTVDLSKLPDKTLYVDCDVIDADGGTRCAAVSGASVALELALRRLFVQGEIPAWPLRERVAAVSVGILGGETLLDLCYEEDSAAAVDMNVVMLGDGRFVEIQGTAEETPFSIEDMQRMLELAKRGLGAIFDRQREALQSLEAVRTQK